jgi:hypothetical protein
MRTNPIISFFAVLLFAAATAPTNGTAALRRPSPDPLPVELNHVYVTLRPDTIAAIAKSAYLAEPFAMLEQNTIRTAGAAWTGIYLIGWHGYLELFAPGGAEGFTAGSSGIGFSTSRLGDGASIKKALSALEGETLLAAPMRRVEGSDSFPWFENIRLRSLDRPLFSAWLMDFEPKYLERKGMPLAGNGRFDRHSYNAASYGRTGRMKEYESRLFDDLTEVHLELNIGEGDAFEKFLLALGFESAESAETRILRSGNFTFFVRLKPTPGYRIRKVVCSLRSAVDPVVEHVFGPDARLRLRGRTAVWTFGGD